MKGKHIELPKGSYVDINDVIEKYDHSPITEMQSVVEKIMIERAKKVDSVILGEIQQIAVENGLETKIILNEKNVLDALRNYQDDYAHIKAEVAREICCKIEEEIVAALESNYRARKEHIERYADLAYDTDLLLEINGKINALRGIEGFVEELKNKYAEGK